MTAQRSMRWLVACLLVLVCAAVVSAGERSYWRHSRGHFENTAENKWTEKSPDGTFHFVEVERTEKFVKLYDKSSGTWVKLYDDRCLVKDPDAKDYELYYYGKWGK